MGSVGHIFVPGLCTLILEDFQFFFLTKLILCLKYLLNRKCRRGILSSFYKVVHQPAHLGEISFTAAAFLCGTSLLLSMKNKSNKINLINVLILVISFYFLKILTRDTNMKTSTRYEMIRSIVVSIYKNNSTIEKF